MEARQSYKVRPDSQKRKESRARDRALQWRTSHTYSLSTQEAEAGELGDLSIKDDKARVKSYM